MSLTADGLTADVMLRVPVSVSDPCDSVWGALHSLVGRGPGEVCGGVLTLLCAITYVCCFVKPLGVLILERSIFIK